MGWHAETFWAIELSSKMRQVEWPPAEKQQQEGQQSDDDDSDESSDDLSRLKLIITMVILGQGVSQTEQQVVEVKTVTSDNKELRIPLVNMKSSQHNMIQIKAIFTNKNRVFFKLVAGDGPVYLSGCVRAENRDSDRDSSPSRSDDTESETSPSEDDSDESASEKESKPQAVSKAGSKRKFTGSTGAKSLPKKMKKQPAKDQRKGGKAIKKR